MQTIHPSLKRQNQRRRMDCRRLHVVQEWLQVQFLLLTCAQSKAEWLCLQIENMDDYVSQDLAVKIIEVDIEKQRVVFSARKATNDKQLEEYNVSDQLVRCTAMTSGRRACQCFILEALSGTYTLYVLGLGCSCVAVTCLCNSLYLRLASRYQYVIIYRCASRCVAISGHVSILQTFGLNKTSIPLHLLVAM